MKQVTFLGTGNQRSAGHNIASGFWRRIAKAIGKATRAPVVSRGVLVSDSRLPRRADAGRHTLIAIFFAAVPILFPDFAPPRCGRKTVGSIAIVHIAVDLAL
jgi:hypothetical protein